MDQNCLGFEYFNTTKKTWDWGCCLGIMWFLWDLLYMTCTDWAYWLVWSGRMDWKGRIHAGHKEVSHCSTDDWWVFTEFNEDWQSSFNINFAVLPLFVSKNTAQWVYGRDQSKHHQVQHPCYCHYWRLWGKQLFAFIILVADCYIFFISAEKLNNNNWTISAWFQFYIFVFSFFF